MRRMAILAMLYLVGCGAASSTGRTVGCGWTPDPEIHGMHLDTDDCHADWCFAPDLKVRIRDSIEAATDYWHTDHDALWGWKLRIVDGWVNCYFESHADGCTDWLHMVITITNGSGVQHCIESTQLVHEVGHVLLPGGDPSHIDGRFADDHILRVKKALVEPLAYSLNDMCKYRDDFMCYTDINPLDAPTAICRP